MNEHTFWYLSRASGMVAWLVLAASCLWGILLVTRMLKPADRPAWLLDLHRWLGGLSVATTAVHLGTLVGDNYVHFGWRELFVPQASAWQPGPVTWGVLAFYVLVVVQLSSLMMKKLPKRLWRSVHLLSYVMFAMATVHGVQAGTDASNQVFVLTATAVLAIVTFSALARYLQARHKRTTRAPAVAQPNVVTT